MTRYKDLDLNFNLNPLSRDINILSGDDAVRRSVRNVVLYNFLEKPFNPRFGGNVIRRLFDQLDPIAVYSVQKQISEAIKQNEPRANLISVDLKLEFDRNYLDVDIVFKVKNSPQPVVLNITLERVR